MDASCTALAHRLLDTMFLVEMLIAGALFWKPLVGPLFDLSVSVDTYVDMLSYIHPWSGGLLCGVHGTFGSGKAQTPSSTSKTRGVTASVELVGCEPKLSTAKLLKPLNTLQNPRNIFPYGPVEYYRDCELQRYFFNKPVGERLEIN